MSEYDHAYINPRSISGRFTTWFDQDYVCVLTIGKTASSAIIESLLDTGVKAFQIHSIDRTPQNYLFFNETRPYIIRNALYKLKVAAWLFVLKSKPRQFITTFREPFERNLSAFFEQIWKIDGLSIDDDIDVLLQGFTDKGPHDVTRNWFRDNLQSKFGFGYHDVSLINQPWRIAQSGKKRFLFLKYEHRDCWEMAIGDFVGAPVSLERRNDSVNKPYAEKIRAVNDLWRPSKEIVRRTIDLELWDALYTPDEKAAIREKWSISASWLP